MRTLAVLLFLCLTQTEASARCYWTFTAAGWYWYCEPDGPRYPPSYPPPR